MSDEELRKLLLEKPESGCKQLLEQYTGLVYAVARRKLSGCLTEEELEELCSDVLFSFYQKREQIDLKRGSIAGLLATMTANLCIDKMRRRSTLAGKNEAAQTELTETIEDDTPSPDTQYLEKERNQVLIDAVHSLGEPDCSIVLWRYFFGQSAAEIGERLSMRKGTVEQRLLRALEKLRKRLGGEADAF